MTRSLSREIALMPHITWTLAEWAATTTYEQLPAPVVAAAKRFLLDAYACAVGGARQPDVEIARSVMSELACRGDVTLLVTGERLDAVSAAFLNSLMIRVMDYNDIYWKQDPSHPSDLIPAALAAAERAGGSGRDLILGIALAYEIEQRLCETAHPGIRELGWHHATLTAVAAPIVAGRMLGLEAAAIQHAVGISASRLSSGSVTAGRLTMMKNTADPFAVQAGVLAALLAERGYTGPEHVLDGKEGFSHLLAADWRWEHLTEGLGSDWRILRCGMKLYPTEALTHGPITAVLELVREHDLAPEDIASVTIHSLARAADILADASKYDPKSKETADHSLPYVIAAAIVDRRVTPAQFTPERIADPVIRAQLGKVKVVADPDIEAAFPELQQVRVTLDTSDGRRLATALDYPKGDYRNPLTEEDIMAKMEALAEGLAGPGDVQRAVAAIAGAEGFDTVRGLTTDLVMSGARP